MLTMQTNLKEIVKLYSLSTEMHKILDFCFPSGISTSEYEKKFQELGNRTAYNSMIALNLINEELSSGRHVLHQVYSPEILLEKSSLESVQMFCFTPFPDRPTVFILPACENGSVTLFKSSGIPIACELIKLNINAIVLNYRLSGTECNSLNDLAHAIRQRICLNSISSTFCQRYILFGFAHGGKLAAEWGDESKGYAYYRLPPPEMIAIASAPLTPNQMNITESFPPTYLIHGALDQTAPLQHAREMDSVLTAQNIPHKFWAVPDAADNFGKGHLTSADGWLSDAINFWKNNCWY